MFGRLGAGIAVALTLALPAVADEPVTTFTLDNGLNVVVIEDHRAPVVVQMIWYRVGAADEPAGHSGIAHFLEHLMFKGTEKIAPNAFSGIVEAQGGDDNAFTSWDYTAYFQRIAADRLDLVMEMEADRMRNLRLTEEDVTTERQVILEERAQRTDSDPGALLMEQMRAAQFLNTPYGIPVIGWRHEMEALSREDALSYYKRFYAPNNATLVIAGDVTPDKVKALAEKYYGPLAPREMVAYADGWPCLGKDGGWLLWVKRPISIDAISYTDPDGLEQTLPASNYLLREELGLTHIVFRQTATLPALDPDADIIISLSAGWPAGGCAPHLKQVVLALTERFNMKRSAELDGDAQNYVDMMLRRDRVHSIA